MMQRQEKAVVLVSIILLSLAAALPVNVNADVTLTFGIYTSDKPSTMVKKFRPILNVLQADLSERLGEPANIRMQVAKSYEKGVEDLVEGRVDFSRFGPASYVMAKKENPDIRLVAMESNKGEKTFNGVICVAKNSSIQTVEELKGKRFAFGNKRSTIGRYLSQLYLRKHGITANDLAEYQYLNRHDKVGAAVAAGQFDAGALKEGTFNRLLAKGAPLRSIAVFPNVTKPWVARNGMPVRIFKAVKKSQLSLKASKALKALKKDGFISGSDGDYRVIREAIEDNARFFK